MTRDEILEYFKDINHAYNDCTRYDTLKRMLDELQEPCTDMISRQAAIEVLNRLNDWTPVEKELPKKGQHVLVSLDSEYVTEDYFAYSTEWFDSFINSEEKVIAWMPMPKSYKAESEVQDADSN